jgi:hypothetical protein
VGAHPRRRTPERPRCTMVTARPPRRIVEVLDDIERSKTKAARTRRWRTPSSARPRRSASSRSGSPASYASSGSPSPVVRCARDSTAVCSSSPCDSAPSRRSY